MLRQEPSMVMKYVDHLDAFVKFRIFSKEAITQLLQNLSISDRRSYVNMILELCVPQLPEATQAHMEVGGEDSERLREVLYDVCVGLNPGLDIHRVVLPVSEETQVEGNSAASPQAQSQAQKRVDAATLSHSLGKRLIGQEKAIESLSKAVARAHAGLRDTNRPVGTYLFIGQTGVGKTELAKVLADELADGDRKPFVRIDCSEYSLPHEYAKLIGAPPGYVGHEKGGFLSSVMSEANASVVLFDEIEKANEKVHNLLLQIMDEGFVTDAKGVRVDFTSSIIILTSNLGVREADALREGMGFGRKLRRQISQEAQCEATEQAIRKKFKPEFLNRIDEIISFRNLDLDDAGRILDKFVGQLAERAGRQGIRFKLHERVRSWLLAEGFSERYGARELRRCVQKSLEASMADAMLTGRITPQRQVVVDLRDGQIVFRGNRKSLGGGGTSETSEQRAEHGRRVARANFNSLPPDLG